MDIQFESWMTEAQKATARAEIEAFLLRVQALPAEDRGPEAPRTGADQD